MIGRSLRTRDLAHADRRAMCALLDRHFHNVSERQFAADLREKQWVIWLEDQAGALAGFSTLSIEAQRVNGALAWFLYSGDTIVDPAHWGSPALARTWIHSVRRLKQGLGIERLWWLLICSGFRTYRFLPVFFREFYPHHDRPTPPQLRALRDQLAARRFGRRFDSARGTLVLEHPQPLREHLQPIPEPRQRDPHVQFFLAQNPGHARGDELVCLTELADDNLTLAGLRMLRQPVARHDRDVA